MLYACAKQYYGWTADPFRKFSCDYFFGYMGYFFLGALLRTVRVNVRLRVAAGIMYLVSSYLIYCMTVHFSFETGKPQQLFLQPMSPLAVLQASSLLVAVKDIAFDSRILSCVAKHTYWMYLLHMLVLETIQQKTGVNIRTNTASHILLLSAGTFAAAFVVSIPLYWLEQQLVRVCSLGWEQFRKALP